MATTPMPDNTLLDVRDLRKHFPIEKGFLRRIVGAVKAVDGISFSIDGGEIVGLVGESGCGKTTSARLILRALKPTSGEILFRTGGGIVDMAVLSRNELKPVRRDIQMIFQDPYSSLNPRMTLFDIVAEPMVNTGFQKNDCRERVAELLTVVGLDAKYTSRYPHAFSGGQRQRIGIARALTLNPSLIVADEPVSALDVSVQAQILNLLKELQENLGLSYLFIAHDLSVISHICDRVAVMYLGRIVELAKSEKLFREPLHPYTQMLISAVPDPDPRVEWLHETPKGEVADASAELQGCAFEPRCSYAIAGCRSEVPVLQGITAGQPDADHKVACFRAAELPAMA